MAQVASMAFSKLRRLPNAGGSFCLVSVSGWQKAILDVSPISHTAAFSAKQTSPSSRDDLAHTPQGRRLATRHPAIRRGAGPQALAAVQRMRARPDRAGRRVVRVEERPSRHAAAAHRPARVSSPRKIERMSAVLSARPAMPLRGNDSIKMRAIKRPVDPSLPSSQRVDRLENDAG